MPDAVPGSRGSCPECGSYDYYRHERTSATRDIRVIVWADGSVNVDDESSDWQEGGDSTFEMFECQNGHRVSAAFDEYLRDIVESPWDSTFQLPPDPVLKEMLDGE